MGGRMDIVPVYEEIALTPGGYQIFDVGWPLGEGWYELLLRFTINLTIGTGTGALVDALQRILTNIQFSTNRDGLIVNAGGRPLFRRAELMNGMFPAQDTFAAATAAYQIEIPIHFSDFLLQRPDDTILDTSRYNKVTLGITLGTVADLLSTVGTSSITATMSAWVKKMFGPLAPQGKPIFSTFLQSKASKDPNTSSFIDLEASADLAYKRILLMTSDAAAPFSGVRSDAIINKFSVENQIGYLGWQRVFADLIRRENMIDYNLQEHAVLSGLHWLDFCYRGSVNDAVLSGPFSRFQVTMENGASVAGKFVHTFIDGFRMLKP